MSNVLIWKDLSDKEKVRLVLEQVLGYYILPDGVFAHGQLDIPKGSKALSDLRWPVAYWNDEIEAWQTKDIAEHSAIFDPLHDMNAAWRVLARMSTRYAYSQTGFEFACGLFGDGEAHTEVYPLADMLWEQNIAQWTPEQICKAALLAVLKEVSHD